MPAMQLSILHYIKFVTRTQLGNGAPKVCPQVPIFWPVCRHNTVSSTWYARHGL